MNKSQEEYFKNGWKRLVAELIYNETDNFNLGLLYEVEETNTLNSWNLIEAYYKIVKVQTRTESRKVAMVCNTLITGIHIQLEITKQLN